jgi:hypothetical protein
MPNLYPTNESMLCTYVCIRAYIFFLRNVHCLFVCHVNCVGRWTVNIKTMLAIMCFLFVCEIVCDCA